MSFHKKNLKSQLLIFSIDIISKEGVDKLTMRYLAQKLEVSQNALYRHYASKNELLFEVISLAYKDLTSHFALALQNQTGNSTDQFISIAKAYVFFAIKNPSVFKLMFSQEIQKGKLRTNFNKEVMQCYQYLLTTLEIGQQKGEISNHYDINNIANLCWSLVHGIANLLIDNQIDIVNHNSPLPNPENHLQNIDEKKIETYLDNILQVFLTGIE